MPVRKDAPRLPTKSKARKAASKVVSNAAESMPRHEAIALAAYFLSEQRGFEPGHELDDWIKAEMQIDAAVVESPPNDLVGGR